MTYDKYMDMCEQMNREPDPEEIPPEVGDFPSDVQKAMLLFNMLGDRVYPDIGYLGKDYTQLNVLMEVYEVGDKKLFLEALLRLDSKVIEKSQAAMKSERDKIKRAS
jgi:hypothetical protein